MGFIKQAKADSMAASAQRAIVEGRKVFVVQIRGAMHNTLAMSHPVADVAEQIEAIEAVGWRLDQLTAVPYKDNITNVCLFRPAHA